MTGYRIFPLGDSALTVEFGNEISVDLNERAIALSEYIEAHPFAGFIETVPAYASTTVFFDITEVKRRIHGYATAFDTVGAIVETAVDRLSVEPRSRDGTTVEIPVHFDGPNAPDLSYVAECSGLTPAQVVDTFTTTTYRVFMLGFLPGFTYMAEVDDMIAVPRRERPRASVPRGSVGIAGRQTGIYSLESPGGWQIIGRTDTEIFTPDAKRPTLLQPGDQVRFVPAG